MAALHPHHKSLLWFGLALAAAGAFWFFEQKKLHQTAMATLTPAGAGDPQFIGGQTVWLGLPQTAPSNALDMTPQMVLTTTNEFVPGSNAPWQIGTPTVTTPTPAQALAGVPQPSGVPPVHFPITTFTQAQLLANQPISAPVNS